MMNGHTFVGYAHEDSDFVGRLAEDLRARGVRLWLDSDIPPGADWDLTIDESLRQCAQGSDVELSYCVPAVESPVGRHDHCIVAEVVEDPGDVAGGKCRGVGCVDVLRCACHLPHAFCGPG